MINLNKINTSIATEFKLPRLNYTGNRQYAAMVIEAIRSKTPSVVEKFDAEINRHMGAIKKQIGKCNPSDFLLFITPLEICEAALSAIQ
jgi:hypothetical protein